MQINDSGFQNICYNIFVDTKSKIVIFAFILLIAGSIYLLYQRSFVKHDFEIIDSSIENVE